MATADRENDSRLSVLHVVAPAAIGGLERVVRTLAVGHARRGHRITVVAVIPGEPSSPQAAGGHPFVAELEGSGVNVIPVYVSPRAYWRERQAVAEACEQCDPDIVHTHGYRPNVVDAGVALARGLPIVTTVHGYTGGQWRNRVYEGIQRHVARRFDAVVAVSQSLAERLVASGVRGSRLHVVPNAYEAADVFLPRPEARAVFGVPDDAVVAGWVGRLSREKGLDVLIAALPLLQDQRVMVVVCGDGPERSKLESQAKALGVAGAMRWLGAVPDVKRLFRGFDLFVLSSRTEGTPITLFEAIDAEIPVVATTVGGVPSVVRDAEARLVVPQDPRALADAMRDVRDDAHAARVRAEGARRRLVTTFALDPWLDRYEAVYRAVRRDGPAVREHLSQATAAMRREMLP